MNKPPAESTALARSEVGTLSPDQRRAVDEVAGLWRSEWTTLEKLPQDELKFAARLIVQAFPAFSPMEVLRYFTVLGGKFYETGEFWLHQAAQHPAYRGAELERIDPASADWKEYLGDQDPAAIAAAVKCVAKRAEYAGGRLLMRDGQEVLRVEIEAAYVTFTDPILNDYEWLDLKGATSRDDAVKKAKDQLAAGAEFEVFWSRGQGDGQGRWIGKGKKLKPDAIALAFKKGRTSASRRCLRRMFSLAEARVNSTLSAVNQRLEEATAEDEPHGTFEALVGGKILRLKRGGDFPAARDPVDLPGSGYSDKPAEPRRAPAPPIDKPTATSTHHDAAAAAERKQITEADRRRIYDWLVGKELTGLGVDNDDAHEAIHVILRAIRKVPPATPVSSTSITYPEYQELARRIEELPPITEAPNPPPFGEGGAQ
jgi:hypothetical protein